MMRALVVVCLAVLHRAVSGFSRVHLEYHHYAADYQVGWWV